MANNRAYNLALKTQAKERAERVHKLRVAGESWVSIGNLLKISRQAAQQLHKRHYV